MILFSPVADSPDLMDTACASYHASVPVPCVPGVNTREGLESLLAGTLNTVHCPSCGASVTLERPTHIDMPELGIGYLRYAPLDMLDNDSVCQLVLVDNHCQLVFYSFYELVRQVRARLSLSRYAANYLNPGGRNPLPTRATNFPKSKIISPSYSPMTGRLLTFILI